MLNVTPIDRTPAKTVFFHPIASPLASLPWHGIASNSQAEYATQTLMIRLDLQSEPIIRRVAGLALQAALVFTLHFLQTLEAGSVPIRKSDTAKNRTSIHWFGIKPVHACKRDCFSVDQIILAFEFEDGKSIQISEDDEDYKEFLQALPKRVDGFLEEKQ